MKLLADENMDGAIVYALRQARHDVLWMVEHAPGMPDADILLIAKREQRIILTFDRDFGELVFHSGHTAPGIVLFRFDPQPPETMLDCFNAVWSKIETKALGNFIV